MDPAARFPDMRALLDALQAARRADRWNTSHVLIAASVAAIIGCGVQAFVSAFDRDEPVAPLACEQERSVFGAEATEP
jgi:hypothetical protein